MSKVLILVLFAAVAVAAAFIGSSYFYLAASLVVGVVAFALASKFIFADRLEAKKSRARAPNVRSALRGRAITREDWLPDARVQGGMIFNRKNRRIEIAGRLSDDSLDRVFG
jgi:hypothetical protein